MLCLLHVSLLYTAIANKHIFLQIVYINFLCFICSLIKSEVRRDFIYFVDAPYTTKLQDKSP